MGRRSCRWRCVDSSLSVPPFSALGNPSEALPLDCREQRFGTGTGLHGQPYAETRSQANSLYGWMHRTLPMPRRLSLRELGSDVHNVERLGRPDRPRKMNSELQRLHFAMPTVTTQAPS